MIELTIHFDGSNEKHLYLQIYEHIKKEIKEGKLLQNERLPSTRTLAENLQISRSTVENAYEQLSSEGYIESRPYKGYFVCRMEELYDFMNSEKKHMLFCEESIQKQEFEIDFSLNGMEKDSFPFATWKAVYQETLLNHGRDLFALGKPEGEIGLRNTISRYLHPSRGVECDPSQIIIGAGNDYLLLLLDKILKVPQTIAMEQISYKRACQVLSACGHTIKRVGIDENGINIEELRKANADLAYVMPAHQFPMGIVTPIGRRMELLKWAYEKEDRYIIEDDYDSEFRYKGKPIPALRASDQLDKVIYIGTFSKSIAPAIRISYLVLPEKLLRKYHQNAAFFASTVSRTDQFMLDEFIKRGHFERHLNKMRKVYKTKHDLLLEELKGFEDLFSISGENAGLHILLHFKGNKKASELQQLAARSGIRVYSLKELTLPEGDIDLANGATILLGYGGLSNLKIKEGVKKLKKAWTVE